MKKIYIHIMMLATMVVAGAAMTSCQKEEATTGKFSMTVNATKGGGNAKALSEDDHTVNATWAVGERVTVYNITKGEPLDGYLEAQSAGASTTLNGTVTGTIAPDDELTLKFCSPNYTSQLGTLDYIATHCDYAEATVRVSSVGGGVVRTQESSAAFVNQQAIVKFTLTDNASTPVALSATQLVVRVGTTDYTINPATGTSEIFVALPGFSVQTVTLTATVGTATYTYKKSGVTFANGQYYEITVGMTEYVDLGLPSGLLWATCNIGANAPEDYGYYFAWGETTTKSTYNWSTYQYCMGSYTTLTKYCNNSSYGYNGFTDTLTVLQPSDDAATANWGDGWRMPTKAEFEELYNNTTVTWTQQNGVNGRLFTASNGNSLFLPAAGHRWDGELLDAGVWVYYWSSSLTTGSPLDAWSFLFSSNYYGMGNYGRSNGFTVRPVRKN